MMTAREEEKERAVTIRRRHRPRNYTDLPNRLIEDERLSWKALGLLAYLLHLPDDWRLNLAHLSSRRAQHGTKRTATASATKEIQEAGYLRIQHERDAKGKYSATVWEVSDEPEFDSSSVSQPQSDFPPADSPPPGNPPLQTKDQNKGNMTTTKKEQQERTPPADVGSSDLIFDRSIQHLAPALHRLLSGVNHNLAQALVDELAGCMQPGSGVVIKNPVGWLRGVMAKAHRGEFQPARALGVQRGRQADEQAACRRAASKAAVSHGVLDPEAQENVKKLLPAGCLSRLDQSRTT
jgi:hypothetical protein